MSLPRDGLTAPTDYTDPEVVAGRIMDGIRSDVAAGLLSDWPTSFADMPDALPRVWDVCAVRSEDLEENLIVMVDARLRLERQSASDVQRGAVMADLFGAILGRRP